MPVQKLTAQTTTQKSFEYFPLNSEISVCKFRCQEQQSENKPMHDTAYQEFFALTAQVERVLKKGINTWTGVACPVPCLSNNLQVLPASLVSRASLFDFHSTFGADTRKQGSEEVSKITGELLKFEELNRRPFSWLQSLQSSDAQELQLYWVDWGNYRVYQLRSSPADAQHALAEAPEISIAGSLSLPLKPISLPFGLDYIRGQVDNGHYKLKAVAEHLFKDPRVNLSQNYDNALEAILSIPYYNSSAERNKYLSFEVTLPQAEFETVFFEAFGLVKYDGKGDIVSAKRKYMTTDDFVAVLKKLDLLGISQFQKPQSDD